MPGSRLRFPLRLSLSLSLSGSLAFFEKRVFHCSSCKCLRVITLITAVH